VDVALAVNDLDAARHASDELEAIARDFASPALEASATAALGALKLAEGDVPGSLDSLRRACAIWQELRLPYEAARARMLYGVALRAAGDEEDASLELRAALSAFERLGAAPDARAATELLAMPMDLPRGLTSREAEVLRLVASGKTNREIAAELVISEHTVARHLQNMFTKLEVSSRSAATAFAFEHGLA
jgi:DNA-binding CsgD family transcriptional regulator